jgi:uncharacterized protein (DUF2141 family)
MSKKIFITFILATISLSNVLANDTIHFTLEINGIKINGGKVYVKIYSNERDYKKDIPYSSFVLESVTENILHSFKIVAGEYLIAIFQDTNNNGKLDTNFFGIPTEPVGLSNYKGGIPGGFNKQKIPINNKSNKITIKVDKL